MANKKIHFFSIKRKKKLIFKKKKRKKEIKKSFLKTGII